MSHKKLIFTSILSIALITCSYFVLANYGFFSGGTNAPSVPEDTMTRGLVGYWSMDEGSGQIAYDASGNGNNGTLGASSAAGSNDPTWTSDGKNAGAMKFDGVDDYVDAGNGDSLQISSEITIELLIYPLDKINDSFKPRIMIGKGNYTSGWDFFISGSNIGLRSNGITPITAYVACNIVANAWNHVVLTYNPSGGANNFKAYLNGTQTGQSTVTGNLLTGGNFAPGYSGTVDFSYYRGSIDEVRVYNRALSADEVRYHYNRGGPVGYWNFDEGSGTTAYDSSINRNNGTLTNFGSTDTGTAESGGDSTLTDSDKTWTTNQWADGSINITGGTGSGQTRTISSNTLTIITVSSAWDTNPDATSTYSLTQAPSWTSGKYGSAIQFDGVDDYVNAGKTGIVATVGTISFWVKPNWNGNDGVTHDFFNIQEAGTTNRIWCYKHSGNTLRILLFGNITAGYKLLSLPVNATNFTSDTWYHYTATYTSSGPTALYLNGILVDDTVTPGGTWDTLDDTSWGNARIGKNVDASDSSIDDVRIYNYARTADEIRLDYQAGMATHLGPSGKTCSEDPASCMDYGLVGSWGMDEGSGTTAYDNSDNGNNGTLGGGTAAYRPNWTNNSPPSLGGAGEGSLKFDGVDDYVDVGTNKTSFKMANNSFSISGWVKGINNEDAYISAIFGVRAITTTSRYALSIRGSNGTIKGGIIDDSGVEKKSEDSVTNYLDGNWHFVTMVVDRTNNVLQLYGDGIETGSAIDISTVTNVISPQGKAVFGTTVFGTTTFFSGSIDDVRIYNRALSAEEIRYHYNKGEPVAHWKFDEGSGTTAYDESFNNNDGTLTNMDNNDWVQGKFGSALDLDGVDDYVDCGNDSSIDITEAITVSAWVRFDELKVQTILAKYLTSDNRAYVIHTTDTNQIRFYISSDGGSSNRAYFTTTNTFSSFTEWYHIVGVFIPSTKQELYVNGVKQSGILTGTIQSSIYSTTDPVLIGQMADSLYFNGLIDDVRIYNYARTQDEILLDYNAGLATHLGPSNKTCSEDPASCMDYGLVGYWDMNEGSGTTAYDASDNGNDGTLTNGPVWTTDSSPSLGASGGGSLKFDGVNDYVNCGSDSSLTGMNYTIEMWAKSEASQNHGALFSKMYYDGITINTINEDLSLYIDDGNITAYYSNFFTLNEWTHIVAIIGTNTYNLYKNGFFVSPSIGNGTFSADDDLINSGPLYFGKWYNNILGKFDGSIDDVRVYNRALSAEEIRYHYNKGEPVAHWKFDEGSGTTAYDESFNNNDGTLINMDNSDWVQGKFGTALDFDGSNDYVKIADDDSLDFGTGDFSYSLWVNTTQDCGGNKVYIGQRENSRPSVWLGCNGTDDTAVFSVEDSNNDGGLGLTTKAINDGKWHHLVGVKEGHSNATITVYIDGIRYTPSSVTFTGHFNYGVAYEYPTNIGNFLGSYYVDAIIDDVRIYNYARTADEILVDYNAGVATHF